MEIGWIILNDSILLVLFLGVQWLFSYYQQSGRNAAIKQDNRKISYEGKKGEHIAQDEDQIVLAHKEHLIRILYIAEKINQSQNKYLLYFYDISSRARFDKLIEDLNTLLTDLYHEQRMANLFIPQSAQQKLDDLVLNAGGIVAEMSTNSSNAAHFISAFNHFMDYADTHNEVKQDYWMHAQKCQKEIEEYKKKKLLFKEPLQQAIQLYAKWLGEYIKQNIRTINQEATEV